MHFSNKGLVTSTDTTGNGAKREFFIPWRHVDLIYNRLIRGADFQTASLVYPINRKETAFILAEYPEFSGVKQYRRGVE